MRKRLISILLSMTIVAGILPTTFVCAADKKITLKQVQNLAISNDTDYKKVLTKIELQQIKYSSAVKSIAMKKKNMRTFRWTPLLNFKFPESPALADEYEWMYKPLQINCTITELKHQLTDEIVAAKEEVSLLYVEAYTCQEKIIFLEDALENTKDSLVKNKARLALGEASQSDIDKLEKEKENLQTQLALQMRTLEAKKSKISKLTKLDITGGYKLENPFVKADVPRKVLQQLVDYTLDHDQSYYEAKLETQLCYTGLNTVNSLMTSQYGRKMSHISGYISQIISGSEVDERNFKLAYDKFLSAIDQPWEGKKRILFIRIPREWFKGSIDGSRYIEDDPYVLYTTALEYASAKKDLDSAKDELTSSVKEGFETLITAKNAYEGAQKNSDTLKKELEKATYKNKLGEFTFEELMDLQEEYEEAELEALELLGEYSTLLYSYDRLTCGGITEYLEGESISSEAASGGISYLEEELAEGAYYHIEAKVEDNVFLLGVSIPEDFSVEITDFELYVDDRQIGGKTAVSDTLKHLALDIDSYEKVEIYLYNGDAIVDICEINPQVYRGELQITGGYRVVEEEKTTVANFEYSMNEMLKTTTIQITPKQGERIAYYQIEDSSGKVVMNEELKAIEEPFVYLALLADDFGRLRVSFYDSSKSLLYKGEFRERTQEIIVMEEE